MPYVTASYVQNIYEGTYPWVVSLSREFYDFDHENPLGVLVIDMNYKTINDICSRVTLGHQGYVYIIDEEGAIVWHPNQQLINSGIYKELIDEVVNIEFGSIFRKVDGTNRIYTVTTSPSTDWRIIGVSYEDELTDSTDQMGLFFIMIAIISITVAFIISRIIAATLSKPIKKIKTVYVNSAEG